MECGNCGKTAEMFRITDENKVWCISCGERKKEVRSSIRDKRKSIGMSQGKLAELCGVHQTYINKIETGKRENIPLHLREKLKEILGVDIPENENLNLKIKESLNGLSFESKQSVMTFINYLKYSEMEKTNER
jgi:transcriptional regulator with XRE-family HTH domain